MQDATGTEDSGDHLENAENLRVVYEQICRGHDGIADFRAKLLAFLPVVSGAGLFALLKDAEPEKMPYLSCLGIFGALISIGLFIYELRGLQKCNVLTECGAEVEALLLNTTKKRGTFSNDPKTAYSVVGALGAALVIYPAVIASWGYVAAIGFKALSSSQKNELPTADAPTLLLPFIIWLVFMLLGCLTWKRFDRLKPWQKA